MTPAGNIETRLATQGERMIEVRVRFWLASEKGKVRPKHGWAAGMVSIEANKAHGITPKGPFPFNSLMDLPLAIERLLIANGICLHAGPRTRKYLILEE